MESDFSAFHRVDDIYTMPSQRFFQLANRLVAYKGVIRSRAEEESTYDEDGYRPKAVQKEYPVPASYQEPMIHHINYTG